MPDRAAPWDAVADEARYERWIISPFARGVEFRLRSDVRRLLAGWRRVDGLERRVVLDLGCGRGDALALVAGRVGGAAGLDFSPRMLDLAERFLTARAVAPSRYRGRTGLVRLAGELRKVSAGAHRGPTTALAQADMRDLSWLRRSADLVLAVNPSAQRARRIRTGCSPRWRTLRPGGLLMAVASSTRSSTSDLAARRGVPLPKVGHVDARGMFHEGGETQKFFTPDEIRTLCRANALRVLSLSKVRYPWTLMRRFGWGHFPGRPRLWDWHLVARCARAPAR
jgi:SAM-dependent methyltransferase